MKKNIFNLFIILILFSCGTTGKLILPEGVDDVSCYKYPPESNIISEDESIIITDQGKVVCRSDT